MMQGNQTSYAPVPTQSYNAANILGTAVPTVGNQGPKPDYVSGVAGKGGKQVVLVALILFGVGYLLYHFNFEK